MVSDCRVVERMSRRSRHSTHYALTHKISWQVPLLETRQTLSRTGHPVAKGSPRTKCIMVRRCELVARDMLPGMVREVYEPAAAPPEQKTTRPARPQSLDFLKLKVKQNRMYTIHEGSFQQSCCVSRDSHVARCGFRAGLCECCD